MNQKFNNNLVKSIAGFFVLIIIIAVLFFQQTDSNLHIFFIDVGQGDSSYVRTMNNKKILIDGGPDHSLINKLGELMPFYDHKIDYIVLTHPHADHLVGLIDVARRYDIGQIITTDVGAASSEYQEWLKTINDYDIPLRLVTAGDDIVVDDKTDLQILWPKDLYHEQAVDNLNNSSIVFRLNYQSTHFMFTGDAEKDVQNTIIAENKSENLKSDVIKIPHHGSKNADNDQFLSFVSPAFAVISAGRDNKFNHPNTETLDSLAKIFAAILRTDQNSTVEFISNGNNLWTKTK